MTDFPGFPSNNFDFHFEEVGPALAGMVVRDVAGFPRAGLFPSHPEVVSKGSGWFLDALPFVAVRAKGRAVLIGGTTEPNQLEVSPAPAANARLDVIWTRPADMDLGEDNIPLQVTSGVPASVPSKPAIPEDAIEVGTFRLQAGATGASSGTLTLTFPTTVSAGSIIPFRSITERNAFNAIPGQMATVGDSLYRRTSTGWQPVSFKFASGVIPDANMDGEEVRSVSISFPAGRFDKEPLVFVTPNNNTRRIIATADASSPTGATVILRNLNTITAPSTGAQWFAIQE